MLIGSINKQATIQGQINEANGVLTGVISNAELIGGQIVGLRGFKGDKGDPGDQGERGFPGIPGEDGRDGVDGQDGFSPSASVSKVGTVATITITDKDGTTTASVSDGSGAGVYVAEYGVTSYSDIDNAYSSGQSIVCRYDDGEFYTHDLTFADVDIYGDYRFLGVVGYSVIEAVVSSNDNWSKTTYYFASTDTATQFRDGLMVALDKQKLDGIASGAEVNVQSDWSQSVNTADDYIKNKPTIPTDLSDLNNDMDVSDFPNDAGYITGYTETDPIFTASASSGITAADISKWNSPPVKVHIQTIPSESYPQNAQTSAYAKGWTADTISGYTPVACLQGTPSNYARLSVQIALDYANYGDRLLGFVFNPYTSALTDTILLPILYIRNDLYT